MLAAKCFVLKEEGESYRGSRNGERMVCTPTYTVPALLDSGNMERKGLGMVAQQ